MAYRLEDDGSRIYLCVDHLPSEEKEAVAKPKLRLVQPSPPKNDPG